MHAPLRTVADQTKHGCEDALSRPRHRLQQQAVSFCGVKRATVTTQAPPQHSEARVSLRLSGAGASMPLRIVTVLEKPWRSIGRGGGFRDSTSRSANLAARSCCCFWSRR